MIWSRSWVSDSKVIIFIKFSDFFVLKSNYKNSDLTQFPSTSDPMKQVDTKTKTALTRTYNKLVIRRSYNVEQKVKGKKTKKKSDEDGSGDENESDHDR